MQNLTQTRRDYSLAELNESDVNPNPIVQFRYWLDEAIKSSNLPEPNSMVLSTVSPEGRPSSRIVLLKHVSDSGFDFFTNYNSRKGRQLLQNMYASLLFFWPTMERQVRIEGKVEKVSSSESDDYFVSRPYEYQIGAWASPQSDIIPNRNTLMDWFKEFESIFDNKELSRPPYWGGFRLVPESFEFWQGRPNRLHDRIEYVLNSNEWIIRRLAP